MVVNNQFEVVKRLLQSKQGVEEDGDVTRCGHVFVFSEKDEFPQMDASHIFGNGRELSTDFGRSFRLFNHSSSCRLFVSVLSTYRHQVIFQQQLLRFLNTLLRHVCYSQLFRCICPSCNSLQPPKQRVCFPSFVLLFTLVQAFHTKTKGQTCKCIF